MKYIGFFTVSRRMIFYAAMSFFVFSTFVGAEEMNPEGKEIMPPQCAQFCVQHICELRGIPITLRQIASIMPPKEIGESMLEIKQALKSVGLDGLGLHLRYGELEDKLPVIAHMSASLFDPEIKTNHWVIVTEILADSVRLYDGNGSYVIISSKQFNKNWTGNILQITEPEKPRRANFLTRVGKNKSFIKFDKTFIYAGDIPQSENYHDFVFPFHNAGTEDLEILDVKTSCSCTKSKDYKNTIIPPGGKGEITIRYTFGNNFSDARNRFAQSAIVHSNDPYSPYIKLTLSGNGRQDIIFSPYVLDFGEIVQGEKGSAKTYVISKGDSVFRIYGTTEPAWLKVTTTPMTKDRIEQLMPSSNVISVARNVYLLSAEVDTSMLKEGLTYGGLGINTNIKDLEKVSVPVKVVVTSDIEAIPTKLFLGGIKENDTINREVIVKSLKGGNVEIVSVDTRSTGLKSLHSTNQNTATIKLTGKLKAKKLKNEKIIITVKADDKLSTVMIPISGIY